MTAHIVARELEAIRMAHEARQAGKACDLAYAGDSPERTKAINDHARRLVSADPQVHDFVAKATDTLMSRLLLTPIDVLVERRLWDRLPGRNAGQGRTVPRRAPERCEKERTGSQRRWAARMTFPGRAG